MTNNINIRPPYGDIFSVSTSHIDQLSNRLYTEEKQREAEQQRQSQQLDNEFGKELVNVKKVDIPDITKAYGDFKQNYIRVYRMGDKATPQDHYSVLESRANLGSAINGSIADKELLKGHSTGIQADQKSGKGIYSSTAAQTVQKYLNTPTSKRIPENDSSELMNQYSVPGLDKELTNARGKSQREVTINLGQSKNDALKDDVETHKVGNNANQFFNSFFQELVQGGKGDNYAGLIDHSYTEQQKEDLTNRYLAKISDPKFIKLYGETQPFNPTALQTKVGQAAAIRTMEEFANMPLVGKTSSIPNDERVTAQRQKDALIRQGRSFTHAEKMAALGQGYREATIDYRSDKDEKSNNDVLNKFIDTSYDAGSDKVTKVTISGKDYTGKLIEVPKALKNEYTIYQGMKDGNPVYLPPSKFYLTDDKKTVIPMYYGDKTSTGGNKLISESKPIPIQLWKASLAKILLTKKQTGAEVTDDELTNSIPEEPHTSTEVHKTVTRKPLSSFVK